MAVIGKIRKRTGLLIGFIAIALLLFLMMDALSSNSMIGSGGKQKVGKINGKSVSIQEFANRYNAYENNIRAINPQQSIDDQTSAAIRDEVWNNIAMDALLGANMEDMGLSVSPLEIGNAMWGDNIHPIVRNLFTNPNTGEFQPEQVRYAVENVNTIDETGNLRNQLRAIENIIEDDRLKTKYASLVSKGIYVPKFMAQEFAMSNAKTASISYLSFPYSDVTNEGISTSEKDLKNYLNENAENYQAEASADLEYIQINIIPSREDSIEALKRAEEIKVEFLETSDDSLFVRRNSNGGFDNAYYTEDQINERALVSTFFNDPVNTLSNPYIEDNAYKISKVIDRKLIADSVKASHILFKYTTIEERDSSFALADSLFELLRDGKLDFSKTAKTHSTDPGSGFKGGDLGYFKQGVMVKPFNDAVFFNTTQGDITKVESQFGLHIIKNVRSKPTTPAVKLAEVVLPLRASKNTESDLYRKALEFEQAHKTSELFKNNEIYSVLEVNNLTQNQVEVPNLGSARDLVQWAYKADQGDVQFFDLSDKFIVAHLAERRKEGTQSLESIKTEIEQKVINEKKTDKIIADIGNALTNATNIQEAASALGKEVKTAQNVRFLSSYIDGAGNEPNISAAVFGTATGQLSKPVSGERGVYVFQVNEFQDPANTNVEFNRLQLKSGIIQKLTFNSILEALKKENSIEDQRFEYY